MILYGTRIPPSNRCKEGPATVPFSPIGIDPQLRQDARGRL
jgi:hypothetical protein